MNLDNFETMDINMLFSIINMKLRDEFDSLDELISYYDISKEKLVERLSSSGYKYDAVHNKFTVS